jgi:hypothetical protein
MAQEDNISRALAGLGASTIAAIGILLGADIPPACAAPATAYTHHPQASKAQDQLIAVLESIKASATELNSLLDEVLLTILKDRAAVERLSASRFPLLAETLRSLEHAVRQVEDLGVGAAQRKEFLKALASIRSRVVDISSIIRQSKSAEMPFESSVDRKGLAALTEHSTRNLYQIAG